MLAIPISLIGAFFIMYIAGFSINILTLLAIVLSTGIVVDDAIVVLENIYKRIEKGTTLWKPVLPDRRRFTLPSSPPPSPWLPCSFPSCSFRFDRAAVREFG